MLDSIFLSLQIKTIMLVNSGRQLCQCHSKNIRTIFSNHRVRRNIGLKSSFMPLFYFSQDILIFFSQLNIFFSPGMQSFDQLLSPNRFTVFVSGIHFFFFFMLSYCPSNCSASRALQKLHFLEPLLNLIWCKFLGKTKQISFSDRVQSLKF